MATRQEKYPETRTFHYYNANPKGRLTGDCVTRAICMALGKSYETVYRELLEMCLKTGYSLASAECYSRYLETQGWKKMKQPRKFDNTKYTGKEWCEKVQDDIDWTENGKQLEQIVAHIGGNHIVAIIDGKVYDTWDSTDGCIGNYWIKE